MSESAKMEAPKLENCIPKISAFHFPWSIVSQLEDKHQKDPSTEDQQRAEFTGYEHAEPDWLHELRPFIETQESKKIAMHLLRVSWNAFKHLRLEDWVKLVMGMPCTPLKLFESFHKDLYHFISSHLLKFPCARNLFWDAKKEIEPIDPFLCSTILQSVSVVEDAEPCIGLEMQDGLIAEPLRRLLSRPEDFIIQRLKILESRYTRYKMGQEIARGRAFDTNTDFFTALSAKEATKLALDMTHEALRSFKELTLIGLESYDRHLRSLANKWDKLNRDVEDVVSMSREYDKLAYIALELHRMRNHFSLSAVLSGLVQGRGQIDRAYSGFVDAHDNYRKYRHQLHSHPSIPFLYPLVIELRRGNGTVVKDIFSFVAYDGFFRRIKKEIYPVKHK